MSFAVNNKWRHGKAHFVFSKMDQRLLAQEGIVPVQVVMDTAFGSEMVLLLIDHTPYVHELAAVRPFKLMLKSGIVKTMHGPVLFHLFYVPDPNDQVAPPLMMIDAHANPFDPIHMMWWRDLSRQSHWHLFLVGSGNEQVGFFEFENTFNLGDTLDIVEKTCAGMPHGDFNAAKQQFSDEYTLESLFVQ